MAPETYTERRKRLIRERNEHILNVDVIELSPKEIAEKYNLTTNWIYILLRKAKENRESE